MLESFSDEKQMIDKLLDLKNIFKKKRQFTDEEIPVWASIE